MKHFGKWKRLETFLLSAFLFLSLLTVSFQVPETIYFQNTAGAGCETAQKTEQNPAFELTAKSAVLMEGTTGRILYEKEKDEPRMIASITKIMTLLLIYEALDSGKLSLEDEITVSEHAASMGGSQVWLEPGEKQTADTMIKCISIASANDAAVAMAEHICGTEEAFVQKMNERAKELGMKNTHFLNCCGLDDDITSGHYSSAYDVALASRELIMNHPDIIRYTTTWMDTFTHVTRKGEKEFGLTNTNKLVRSYEGITGLKTGSTSKAKYCLSATATRNNVSLIAVVLASEEPKGRFEDARRLLDYGFSNVSLYTDKIKKEVFTVPVSGGTEKELCCHAENDFSYVLMNGATAEQMEKEVCLPEKIDAPVKKGEPVGYVRYSLNGKEAGQISINADAPVEKAGLSFYFFKIVHKYFLKAEDMVQ